MGCFNVSGVARVARQLTMRLLMVVNVDWFFLSHRLQVALGALNAGYEVHIATSLTKGREQLEAYGFKVHPIDIDRSATGIVGLIRLFSRLVRLFWTLKPDVLHLVTVKPVLIGGAAARVSPVGGVVYAISGLGHVFLAEGLLSLIRRVTVGAWYRFVLGVQNMRIIFQNKDDLNEIALFAPLSNNQVIMIPGSGVDLTEYRYTSLPEGVPMVLMAARLLGTKGVREFVAAAQMLRSDGAKARFCLVGSLDPENPATITKQELNEWAKKGCVELLGSRSDIPELMAQAYLVVLPSYREGFPRVLLEAAACGRAVVTTNVPGCRDAIEDGVTGVLVPPKNSLVLAGAIRQLLENPALCKAMGKAGRQRAVRIFDVNAVVDTHLNIYNALRQRPHDGAVNRG